MSLTTNKVWENEILKQPDLDFANDSNLSNLSLIFNYFLTNGRKDINFIFGGKVKPYPSLGMFASISPVMAFEKTSGRIFVQTDVTEPVEFEPADETRDRIDIVEIKGIEEDYDKQTRAFKDPRTKEISYAETFTKKRVVLEAKVKKGDYDMPASPVDVGWIKIAEVRIPAGTLNITADLINNVTARVPGNENAEWTTNIHETFEPRTAEALNMKTETVYSVEQRVTDEIWFNGKKFYRRTIILNQDNFSQTDFIGLHGGVYTVDADLSDVEELFVDTELSYIKLADNIYRRFVSGAMDGKNKIRLESNETNLDNYEGRLIIKYTLKGDEE